MPKKKAAKPRASKKSDLETVIEYVKHSVDILLGRIKEKIDEIKRVIIKKVIVISLLWFAAFFILLGVAQKLVEEFPNLGLSGSLWVVGGILLIVALIFHAGSKK